jgi:hypothetical protein
MGAGSTAERMERPPEVRGISPAKSRSIRHLPRLFVVDDRFHFLEDIVRNGFHSHDLFLRAQQLAPLLRRRSGLVPRTHIRGQHLRTGSKRVSIASRLCR